MADALLDKILGCIFGAAIGDTIGAVIEFADREGVRRRLGGKEWVEDMHGFVDRPRNSLGVFRENPPRGTGTDDTRLNHIFLECVVKNDGQITSELLAREYLDRYENVEKYYPKTPELGRKHMKLFYSLSRTVLGMDEPPPGGMAPYHRRQMNCFPILAGLLSLPSAGLLFGDDPEQAYLKAAALDIFDIGFAIDATAMMAATVSAALGEGPRTAREVLGVGISTDPHGFSEHRRGRIMGGEVRLHPNAPSLPKMFEACDAASDDRAAVLALARLCVPLHHFSPLDVLGAPLAIIRHTDGDPVRSVLMAANHRRVDEEGNLIQMRDVDCVAMVAGAIVGAISGIDAWPADWVQAVQSANLDVYGFDIERNARAFHAAVYG